MSLTEGLRKGMVIRHQGQLYTILDFKVSQSGKMRPTVHVKLRSVAKGLAGERSLDELGKIEEVATEIRQLQYLYPSGENRVFMDTQSFEEYAFDEARLGDDANFLVEGETYRFLAIEGRPELLQLPLVVVIEVADTAPVEHSGGGSNIQKEAKLASGLMIHVPLFIKTGDKIRVRTDTREYQGKEH